MKLLMLMLTLLAANWAHAGGSIGLRGGGGGASFEVEDGAGAVYEILASPVTVGANLYRVQVLDIRTNLKFETTVSGDQIIMRQSDHTLVLTPDFFTQEL